MGPKMLILTWYKFPIECLYNRLALFLGLHTDKADTSANSIRIPKYSSRDDLAEIGKHLLKVILGHVDRQVSNVKVSDIALLLLKITIKSHSQVLKMHVLYTW